jgi:hypothetical protein
MALQRFFTISSPSAATRLRRVSASQTPCTRVGCEEPFAPGRPPRPLSRLAPGFHQELFRSVWGLLQNTVCNRLPGSPTWRSPPGSVQLSTLYSPLSARRTKHPARRPRPRPCPVGQLRASWGPDGTRGTGLQERILGEGPAHLQMTDESGGGHGSHGRGGNTAQLVQAVFGPLEQAGMRQVGGARQAHPHGCQACMQCFERDSEQRWAAIR